MKNNIEKIVEEFDLSSEDLIVIDQMMHKRSSHLAGSEDWARGYIIEFKSCVDDYLESKPKHL